MQGSSGTSNELDGARSSTDGSSPKYNADGESIGTTRSGSVDTTTSGESESLTETDLHENCSDDGALKRHFVAFQGTSRSDSMESNNYESCNAGAALCDTNKNIRLITLSRFLTLFVCIMLATSTMIAIIKLNRVLNREFVHFQLAASACVLLMVTTAASLTIALALCKISHYIHDNNDNICTKMNNHSRQDDYTFHRKVAYSLYSFIAIIGVALGSLEAIQMFRMLEVVNPPEWLFSATLFVEMIIPIAMIGAFLGLRSLTAADSTEQKDNKILINSIIFQESSLATDKNAWRSMQDVHQTRDR